MTTANESRRTFNKAILDAITFLAEERTMSNPVISARPLEKGSDHYAFEFTSEAHLQDEDVIWVCVESDSFGDFDCSDLEGEADALEDNMFEDAINDVNDAFISA